jgi:subtilisin family serine protease
MGSIIKVFCSGADQKALAKTYRIIEPYQAFVLVEASPKVKELLSASYPVEDITAEYRLQIGDRTVDPAREQGRLATKGLKLRATTADGKLSSGYHHYIVQFIGPIKDAWLRQVKALGGQLRIPFGGFAYIILLDNKEAKKVASLSIVRFIGHLPHKQRIAPSVMRNVGRLATDTSSELLRTRIRPGVYSIEFFSSKDVMPVAARAKKLGFQVLSKDRKANLVIVQSTEGAARRRRQIEQLSAIHGVKFIRERAMKRLSNDVAAGILGTTKSLAPSGLGLTGQGEIIAVCDTGLDTGDPNTILADFSGRIASIKSYPITPDFSSEITNPGGNDGAADVDSGHGTHVTGSILGDGTLSAGLAGLQGPIRGLAFKAKLVFQAVEQEMHRKRNNPGDRYELSGLPQDLHTLFKDAYRKGARIHSNSWGGGQPGEYDSQCEQLDDFTWNHKDFCIVVAAGNDGNDRDRDGKIKLGSVTSPGTAKNCITVGACENLRPIFNNFTYGWNWEQDFPVRPFKDDPMADDPQQVVAFSSRGPTKDMRFKPDIIAPGTYILSTRSTQIKNSQFGWGRFPQSNHYMYDCGTSMATPLIAGAAAIVREFYRVKRRVKQPSAALLKATLIAGAERLPGTAPRGVLVDNHQGFGRVNLDNVLSPPKPYLMTFWDVAPGLTTGHQTQFAVSVRSQRSPIRVVLAYSDYPGENLVNNLNLIVTSPTGERYTGNQPVGTQIISLDSTNNVEMVGVVATPGTWKINVVASNIPHGPQPFAVVCIHG